MVSMSEQASLIRRIRSEMRTNKMKGAPRDVQALHRRLQGAGCEISKSAVYKILEGARKVQVEELRALASIFGLSMEEMLEGDGPAARKERELFRAWQDALVAREIAIAAEREAFEELQVQIRQGSEEAVKRALIASVKEWASNTEGSPRDRLADLLVEVGLIIEIKDTDGDAAKSGAEGGPVKRAMLRPSPTRWAGA
jgi:hypothetical protein